MIGEQKNCMTAKTVPKRPSILAALEVSPWRKPSMRRGRTGAIMPRASMSSVTVKKIKVAAARRPLGGSERFVQADQFGLGEQRVGGGNRLGRILRRI